MPRVAIITGASRGIGRGIAIALGQCGWTVYVLGRTGQPGTGRWPGSVIETADAVTAAGGLGIAITGDANRDRDLEHLVDRVIDEVGQIDLLVNSAYAFPSEFDDTPRGIPFWELPMALWDSQMGAGLRGCYSLTRLAAPHMITAGQGRIINMSSTGGDAYLFNPPYGVAKAAIERLTCDLAVELNPFGIAITALRPGPVLTERIRQSPWGGRVSGKRVSPLSVGRAVLALNAKPFAEIAGQVFDARMLDVPTYDDDFGYLAT